MEKDELFLRFRDERDDPAARESLRDKIASDTEAFLAKGGEITTVEAGEGRNTPVPITSLRLWEINK